jgi:hypothetical protein
MTGKHGGGVSESEVRFAGAPADSVVNGRPEGEVPAAVTVLAVWAQKAVIGIRDIPWLAEEGCYWHYEFE